MQYINRESKTIHRAVQYDGDNVGELAKILPLDYTYALKAGDVKQISISGADVESIYIEPSDYLIIKNGKPFVIKEEFFFRFYKPRKTIVLLNGAPSCGKDTIAQMLRNEIFGEGSIHAFKDQLYKATAEFYKLNLLQTIELCTNRETKEKLNKVFPVDARNFNLLQKFKMFFGRLFGVPYYLTPRQALIYVSEQIYKPVAGNDYFGKCLLQAIERDTSTYNFIPDSGFIEEIPPLTQEGHRVILVQIHRDGCTFEGDSRRFITQEECKELGIDFVQLDNNNSLEQLKEDLTNLSLGCIL